MKSLQKIVLLGLLGTCSLYFMMNISPAFAYTDTCNSGMCFVFDNSSATNGYRFTQGAQINITGVQSLTTTPAIQIIPADGSPSSPSVVFQMQYDANAHTVYLGASSGLPTYVMINSNPTCNAISICDLFSFHMNAPSTTSPPNPPFNFVVKYYSDINNLNTPTLTSSALNVTPAMDDSIPSNPNQPYKNVKASCSTSWTSDGFCPTWKTSNGLSIPFTASGVTATYHWTCATDFNDMVNSGFTKDFPCNITDPSKSDVYVEIDYMKNHRPDKSAILDLINAFSMHNVNLHVLLDEQTSYKALVSGPLNGADSSDFTTIKNAFFGTSSERSATQATSNLYCNGNTNYAQCVKNLLTAKRQVFHYVLFGDSQSQNTLSSGVSEAVSSGTTAYAANDIFVSLGNWNYKRGSAAQQEGTLMHELGHNLGLGHGGSYALQNSQSPVDTDVNCKPNRLSVMSYTRQFPTLVPDRPLDYSSEGRTMQSLTNTQFDIDEVNGFTEAPVSSNSQDTAFWLNSLGIWTTTMANTPDWNNNGVSGDSISAGTIIHTSSTPFKINIPGGTPISISCGSVTAADLKAYNDWSSLGYNIWGSSSAYDGAGDDPIPSEAYHGVKIVLKGGNPGP